MKSYKTCAASLLLALALFQASAPLSLAQNQKAPAAGAAVAAAPEVKPTELPMTRAVLFSSGVGYFECAGTIEDNASVRLLFKTDQINDVLKSMVIMDEGGNLPSVTYPSNDPIERSLKSFGVNLSGNPTISDLLTQLRGAQVSISAPDKITGAILSVEAQNKVSAGAGGFQTTEYIISIVTDSGIRSVPLSSVSKIEFTDPKLQDEMNKALALLVASRDTDRKPVDIRFEGKGKRQVRIGYLVESPVWKTSYRLDLSGEKPLLQGWAIVENTSDIDWQSVSLSLVSGRPISFVMDLYTPLYLQRPTVVQEQFAFLRPQVYAEGMEQEKAAGIMMNKTADSKREFDRQSSRGLARNMPMAAAAPMAPGMAARDGLAIGGGAGGVAFNASAQAMAAGSSVGELFEFNLKDPVNISRRKSSMLPIINQTIDAEKVSIFNVNVMRDRPLNGVLLNNSTGLKMLAGPITVFDGQTYAGDAQIDNVSPGDKRLLSYAVDLSVTADTSQNYNQQFLAAKIVKGVLYITRKHLWTQNYTFKNKSKVDKILIVEHPFVQGRELLEPAKFEEKTATLYRFRFPVAAGKTQTLAVKEQMPWGETIALLDYPLDAVVMYSNSGEIPKEVREALGKVATVKRALFDMQQSQQQMRNEIGQITAEQDRLRQDINAAGRETSLGKRYLEKLNTQEDRIELLQKKISDLQTQIEAKQKELSDLVAALNVG